MVKLPIMSPGAEDMEIGNCVMNRLFLCVINGQFLLPSMQGITGLIMSYLSTDFVS